MLTLFYILLFIVLAVSIILNTKYYKEYQLYLGVMKIIKETPLIELNKKWMTIKTECLPLLTKRLEKKGYHLKREAIAEVPDYSLVSLSFIKG